MPIFPTATTWPITAYEYDVEVSPGTPARSTPTPQDWRNAFSESVVLPTVPDENTRYHGGEAFGWGGFTDNEPMILEPYLVFMRRAFVKRVPPSTLKAAVEQQCERWVETRRAEGSDIHRVPKAVRVEIRERLIESMLKQALPVIKNVVVIVDTAARRAYVLARGKSGEQGIATNLRKLIAKAHGGTVQVSINEINLAHYMVWAHGATHLPADVSREFMHDLAHHARCAHTLRIDDAQFPSVMLELGGRIELVSGDDRETLRASGTREAERLLSERIEDGEDGEEHDDAVERSDAELTRLQFVAHDEAGAWSFVIGRNADIQRAEMPRLGLDVSDGQEGSVWARVAMVARAVAILQGIVHAFTVGRLAEIVQQQPQQPLFESRVTSGACAPATWLEVAERPAVLVHDAAARASKQAEMFEEVKPISGEQAEIFARATAAGLDVADLRFAVGVIQKTKAGEPVVLEDVARAKAILLKVRPDLATAEAGLLNAPPDVLSASQKKALAKALDKGDGVRAADIIADAILPPSAARDGRGGSVSVTEAQAKSGIATIDRAADDDDTPEPGEDLAAERAAALRSKAIGRGYDATVVDAVLRDEAAARGGEASAPVTSETAAKAPPAGKTVSLAGDVLDVLRRSTIDGNTLRLPDQLDRALYGRVNKALEAAGGKWNRRAGAHVFDSAPGERLGLDTGTVIKAPDPKQTFQVFETPTDLATRMAEVVSRGDLVLEPSCGSGRLVAAAVARGATVEAVELREDVVVPTGASCLIRGDFLKIRPMPRFDAILMNPPFAKGQDIAHVTHALDFLRPGGRLMAVMSGSVPYAENRKAAAFRELIAKHGGRFEELPAGTFKSEGTNASTVLLDLRRAP